MKPSAHSVKRGSPPEAFWRRRRRAHEKGPNPAAKDTHETHLTTLWGLLLVTVLRAAQDVVRVMRLQQRSQRTRLQKPSHRVNDAVATADALLPSVSFCSASNEVLLSDAFMMLSKHFRRVGQ